MYSITWNEAVGRHLVAKCAIKSGDVIINEEAIVQGPSPTCTEDTGALPVICTVCYRHIYGNGVKCDACGVINCSDVCNANALHSTRDCLILRKIPHLLPKLVSNLPTFYQFITVIRCLWLCKNDKLKWTQIQTLQANQPLPDPVLTHTLDSLSWDLFSDHSFNSHEIETISLTQCGLQCLGALQTNSFSNIQRSRSVENLYFFTSLMAHSCLPNTCRQFHPSSSRVLLIASKEIKIGEPITNSYIPILSNTYERFMQLSSSPWNFVCTCWRCQSKTELDTFLGCIQCPNCRNNSLSPMVCSKRKILYWKCEGCPINNTNYFQSDILPQLKDIGYNQKHRKLFVESDQFEMYTSKIISIVHENHSLISNLKCHWAQVTTDISVVSNSDLQKRISYGRDILSILDKLFPGEIQMLTGRILFCLVISMRELQLRQNNPSSDIDLEIAKLAEKAINILRFGIPGTDESEMLLFMQDL